MGQLGDTVGGLMSAVSEAIGGLMDGIIDAFAVAFGDLAAVVPGGVVGILIVIVASVAFGWFLLRK